MTKPNAIKITARGPCSLTLEVRKGWKAYVMRGPSGVHVLAVSETGKERMRAHWKGFCSYNKVQAREFNLPSK
jgi:hypothetical protein